MLKRISLLSIVGLLLLTWSAPASAQRVWGLVTTLNQDYGARSSDNSLGPPEGPDRPVRQVFRISQPGLVRITHRLNPYYPPSQRDPNTGGLGLPRLGDDSVWPRPRLVSATVPDPPVPGQPLTSYVVGEVTPGEYWVSVGPALSFRWGQLAIRHQVTVEFSAGRAQPGETWGPGETRGASQAKAAVTTWDFTANGYPGRLEITLQGGRASGRLLYDVTGRWENLTDVVYDPASGSLTFTRPWAGNPQFQQYAGKVSGGSVVGTFTDSNSPGQRFPWKGQVRR